MTSVVFAPLIPAWLAMPLAAAAILLLAVLAAGVLYVWRQDKQQQAAAKPEPLKKAA